MANQCPLFDCDHASNLSDWSGSVFDPCYWLSFRPALTPQMPPGPPQLWGTAPAGELRHLGRISPNPWFRSWGSRPVDPRGGIWGISGREGRPRTAQRVLARRREIAIRRTSARQCARMLSGAPPGHEFRAVDRPRASGSALAATAMGLVTQCPPGLKKCQECVGK